MGRELEGMSLLEALKPDPTDPAEPIMPRGYHNPIKRIPRWKTALNLVVIALAVALLAYSVGPTLIGMIWRNR
jgi:hypothetical protein